MPITLIFRLLTDGPDATRTESSRNLSEIACLQHSVCIHRYNRYFSLGQFPKFASLIRVSRTQKCLWMELLLAVSMGTFAQNIATSPALRDRGQVHGLTYSNATLGFNYQLPQGFLVNPNLPLGSLILTVADKDNGTPWRDRIVLADSGQYSGLISDYAIHYVRAVAANSHVFVLRHRRSLKVAGRDFFRIDFLTTSEGKIEYQDFVCTRVKGSLVAWTFISLNEQQVEEMAASINSVTFASAKAR
jgi:hypothetical protein